MWKQTIAKKINFKINFLLYCLYLVLIKPYHYKINHYGKMQTLQD